MKNDVLTVKTGVKRSLIAVMIISSFVQASHINVIDAQTAGSVPPDWLVEEPRVKSFRLAKEVIELTNKERQENGLNPLHMDDSLIKVTAAKTKDMNENNYFEHVSPKGVDLKGLMNTFQMQYTVAGENIARGYFDDAKGVFGAWKNSPEHYKNMMDRRFTHIAVVYCNGYWTQHFLCK